MSPISDSTLVVRAAAAGTIAPSTPTLIEKDLKATTLKGVALWVNTGALTSGAGTLGITIFGSDSTPVVTTDPVVAQRTLLAANKQYIIPFSTKYRYVAFRFAPAAAGTPTFTAPIANIVEPLGQDWGRDVIWT